MDDINHLVGGLLEDLIESCASTILWHPGKRIARKTKDLRLAIWEALEGVSLTATVRHVFYLVASKGLCPKTNSGYRQVQRQVLAMRREGFISHDKIADNTRYRLKPSTHANLGDFLERSAKRYRQDIWLDADAYVEVWCEKDSIAGVLSPITEEFDVPLYVARGYSSESFCYEAAQHMRASCKPPFVYYLGDFDPSGWHMSQNLEDRLRGFCPEVRFERLGVNVEQVRDWNLQTRPTKKKDTRAASFFDEFGRDAESVELEAVHPDTLAGLLRDVIQSHVDPALLKQVQLEEKAAREALGSFATNLPTNSTAKGRMK